MNLNKFIDSISTIPYRKLDNEIDFALNNREQVTPELIKLLQNKSRPIKDDDENVGHRFALYFLAVFREQEAFPLIIEFLHKLDEGQINEDLENMPNILASTFNGDLDLLYQLIEDDDAYHFSRISALESLVVLVLTNQVKRKVVIDYFKRLLNHNFKGESANDMSMWVIFSAFLLYPVEIISDIRLRFYFISLDIFFDCNEVITPKDFEKSMIEGQSHIEENYLSQQDYHIITKLEDEFEDWSWFSPKVDYAALQQVDPLDMVKSSVAVDQQEKNTALSESSDDYYFVGDDKHMAYCHKLFGDFNEAGLRTLQDKYDTDHIKLAQDKVYELLRGLDELNRNLEVMRGAARELVEGEGYWSNSYNTNDNGDVGYFAYDLYETASMIETEFQEVTKRLAPLSRLMPLEDDDGDEELFQKEVEDWLDHPERFNSGARYDFDF